MAEANIKIEKPNNCSNQNPLANYDEDVRLEDCPESRTASESDLHDRKFSVSCSSLGQKSINSEIFRRYFSSADKSVDNDLGNDQLPSDLELNIHMVVSQEMLEELGDSPDVDFDCNNNRSTSNLHVDEPNEFSANQDDVVQSIGSISSSLHSILGDLRSIPSQAHMCANINDDNKFNGSSSNLVFSPQPKNSTELHDSIWKISKSRSPKDFFVWVLREKHDFKTFRVNVIDEKYGKLLGSLRISEEIFQQSQADGIFDSFLSLLLLDSFE